MEMYNIPLFISPLPVSGLSEKQEKGGLVPTDGIMGDVVLRATIQNITANEKNSTPIKPSPESVATSHQPIICQNPHINAL